ncbi:MAG: NifU family protein [Acidimicrobiia bacterium]
MENVLSVASEALDMIIGLRDQEPGESEVALLIEVTGTRQGQYAYELAFVPIDDEDEGHHLERHGNLAILVPQQSVEPLRGASLSIGPDGLAMDNPNRPLASPAMAAPQGTLEGPLAEQVSQVIAEAVNPAIAAHGGRAELVSVEGTIAYLKLSGGCQGCGMAAVTLKQGIERILKESISELSEVVDVTDHASGSDPYFQSSKK